MAVHPDVARFTRALEARGSSTPSDDDLAFLDELFADDVIWHGAANGGGNDVQGKDQVVSSWNAFANQAGVSVTGASDVYADGVHAAGIVDYTVDGAGSVRQAHIVHLKSGKVTEVWGLPTDQAIAEAAEKKQPVPVHPNVEHFRAAEEARQRSVFDESDNAIIARFLADEVIWHMGGDTEWAQQPAASRRDEVIEKFLMFKQATGGTLFFDIHEVFADDTHAASFVRLTADRPDNPDKHMNVLEVNIFHLDRDGRAYEFWGIPTDEEERDSFWT